ncbi:MAG: hypothetical protein CVV61_01410 [Tenericutes bacterium HGW-Tenericutes-6]|nr:MAG: hypothetical protein CVV61_01410 [Tenericutes bacterium HGW-Tenericutes-6]
MYAYLSKYYNQIFPHNKAFKVLLKGFSKEKRNAIDIGCGTGRLANDLFELGMKVIGIDLNEHMIEVAKHSYSAIDFKVMDMLQINDLNQTYQIMTCFGNTLPHIDQVSLNRWINSLYPLLDKDGVIIIQLLNYEHILKHKPSSLPLVEFESLKFMRSYVYHKDHITFQTELIHDGVTFKGQETLYPYTSEDLRKLFESASFDVSLYGSPLLKPFEKDDYYLFLVARKKCQ